jgi:hypothetical protein
MSIPSAIRTAITVALGFVRERAPESSTRLVMVLCTLGGLGSAYGAYHFAMANPAQTGTVGVLAGIVGAFIGSGAVAIALRTRKDAEPGDAAIPPVIPPAIPQPPTGPQL